MTGLFWSKGRRTESRWRLVWPGVAESAVFSTAAVCEKLMAEYTSGNIEAGGCAAEQCDGTGWFAGAARALPVCFLSKRLAFWRHDHADVGAQQGAGGLYLGSDVERCEVFGSLGLWCGGSTEEPRRRKGARVARKKAVC